MVKALLQVSLAAGLVSTALQADDWSKKFAISGRPDLRVDANDGSVTIRTWDRKEVEARVTTIGWRIGPGGVTVADHQSGDRAELEVKDPNRAFYVSFGRRSVRVELQGLH